MIVCSTCHHREPVGAIFCSECGMQLVFSQDEATQIVEYPRPQEDSRFSSQVWQATEQSAFPTAGGRTRILLQIVGEETVLPVSGRPEVTLGRLSEGQPVIPDIDLSPYKAYEAGVSRMHAAIKISSDEITVTDLSSANGTRLNGQKVPAYLPTPIQSGDILTLGTLKIRLLVRE